MKWLALTFGGASTLYRVEQYVSLLRDLSIELICRPAGEVSANSSFAEYDGIVLQKKLLSWSKRRRISQSGLPVIFDMDDATWHPLENEHHFLTRWRTQRRLTALLKLARLALPANEFIAGHLRQHHARVEVLPMTLKLADWQPAPQPKGPIVLGWAGAPGNHFQLRSIDAALHAVKRAMPEVIVRIFSGVRPEMSAEIDFLPFDLEKQTEVLRSFSIGLLPLPDTPFNHGKSPIKALQYMAAGIPCVASALSGTVEMLGEKDGGALYAYTTPEWIEKLMHLICDAALRREMGASGRARFEQHYTAEAAARTLAARMRELAAPRS
jgi:glycosyltransferase involved in cell wall biosynthesis